MKSILINPVVNTALPRREQYRQMIQVVDNMDIVPSNTPTSSIHESDPGFDVMDELNSGYEFDSFFEDTTYQNDILEEETKQRNIYMSYWSHVLGDSEIPPEIRDYVSQNVCDAMKTVQKFVNDHPLHQYHELIISIIQWLEENAPTATYFTWERPLSPEGNKVVTIEQLFCNTTSTIENDPSSDTHNHVQSPNDNTFTVIDQSTPARCVITLVYQKCVGKALSMPAHFGQLVWNLIPLWNLKIWIRKGATVVTPAVISELICKEIQTLDISCTIFNKYYRRVRQKVRFNRDCEWSKEYDKALSSYIGSVVKVMQECIANDPKAFSRSLLRLCFRDKLLLNMKCACSISVVRNNDKRRGMIDISMEYVKDGKPSSCEIVDCPIDFLPLLKVWMLIYNCILYVGCFDATENREFTGGEDLIELVHMAWKRFVDSKL